MEEKQSLKLLFAASEAVPFVKTGGLGDVAGSLPHALVARGVEAKVILPNYASIPAKYREQMVHVADLYVPLSWRSVYCGVEKLRYEGVEYYFVDNHDYFYRDSLYGYFDDGERFAFFAKAICEAIQFIPELQVDVLEANDWQAALACVFLREFYQQSPACAHVKTVFTVHNVKFQGQFGKEVLSDILGLADNPAAKSQLSVADGSINYMLGALNYADAITTVSPTYAGELQMAFFGEGLDGVFRRRSNILSGILNGIDPKVWNPEDDPYIAYHYSSDSLTEKAKNKEALQKELGLAVDPTRPLVAMIGRLTNQKGLGLVRYAMHTLMERGVQVAILGTGDADQEEAFRYFDATYGNQMVARITFDNALSHRMYAGADILLMPSEFEPCGLSQMIAMRYGTLPVVRECGGLSDSVLPYNKYTGEGTGFSFANMNADEMTDCLLSACEIFWTQPEAWQQLQKQAMAKDFSWGPASVEYFNLFASLHPEAFYKFVPLSLPKVELVAPEAREPKAEEPKVEEPKVEAQKPAPKRTRKKVASSAPAAKKAPQKVEAKEANASAEEAKPAKKRTSRVKSTGEKRPAKSTRTTKTVRQAKQK